jgi:hypothetical protein
MRLGRHDAIISFELFELAAKALDDRRTRKPQAPALERCGH